MLSKCLYTSMQRHTTCNIVDVVLDKEHCQMSLDGSPKCLGKVRMGVSMKTTLIEEVEQLVTLLKPGGLRSVDVSHLLTTQHVSAAQLVQQAVLTLEVTAQCAAVSLQATLEL